MNIGFLGAGNIAQAIMGGMINNGFNPADLIAHDPAPHSREKLASLGVRSAADNHQVVDVADAILLCVKPDVLPGMLEALDADVTGKLFISVAAGVTVATITGKLGDSAAVIRCMPNTPALVQTGMTAMYASESVSSAQRALAMEILSAVGEALWVDTESQLDTVTAVSGSGPAYFFLMMESMISAATAQGLPQATAETLVLQTALGAAKMARQSEQKPDVLRQQVTSPGGTTQAAISYFEKAGFTDIVHGAVSAARVRSIELSES